MGLFELLLVVGVHTEEARDAGLLADGGVEDFRAGHEGARVDAGEDDLTHVLIGHNLEGERGERLVVIGLTNDGGIGFVLHRGDVERGGEVADHRVEEDLDALVLEGGAAEGRHNRAGNAALAQALDDLFLREGALFEVLVHQLFVLLGGGLDHLVAHLLALLLELGGNLGVDLLHALRFLIVGHQAVLEQVHHALEGLASAQRADHRHRTGLELIPNLVHHREEVRANAVHLVNEDELGHFVLFGLTPDLLGLRLHATDRAEDRHRAIEHAQRALHLGREVHVTGGVNQGDHVVAPHHGRGRGGNRDAALLLLHHPVHRGAAIMHFADLVVLTGIEEDTLGGRRLTGVNVGHNANVAQMVQRDFACHN